MIREQETFCVLKHLCTCICCIVVLIIGLMSLLLFINNGGTHAADVPVLAASLNKKSPPYWTPPDSLLIPDTPDGDRIRYGQELISHTALYLGPKGIVRAISNGMNCQNCHLKAGKKIFGNNYSAVASTYPKFRARSGGEETIEKRVNDCIERSLNGIALEKNSKELDAIVSYIKWVGQSVPKNSLPPGQGLIDLPFLDRAANPMLGKIVYQRECARCHGIDAKGEYNSDNVEWKYPPVAGEHSYNTGAGLFRISRFAAYVKANMPNGTSYEKPALSDEEAWDVAAYVNSLPRPVKTFPADWPDISKKPIDHPFGPYADTFSEFEHKYGPFTSMKKKK
jgi:thiosulfate dehydrogenase